MTFSTVFSKVASQAISTGTNTFSASSLSENLDRWLVGMDGDGFPCVFIESDVTRNRNTPSIKLESLDVGFHLPCEIALPEGMKRKSVFTVIRLNSRKGELRDVFFSICDAIVLLLGSAPSENEVSEAVERLVLVFRKIANPPLQTSTGLFGEMILIFRSRQPDLVIRDWRNAKDDRYDFSTNDLKVEVKTSAFRRRIHDFSSEQCAPPSHAFGLLSSIFVERAGNGTSILELQQMIERRLVSKPEAILKLRETVAGTLGQAPQDETVMKYDLWLAVESVAFYRLIDVPAVRDCESPHVSNIRFTSDLNHLKPFSTDELEDLNPDFSAYSTTVPS